jgi:hypothetical protein
MPQGTQQLLCQQCNNARDHRKSRHPPGKRKRDLKMKWGRHRALLAQTAEPHPTYATGGRRVEIEREERRADVQYAVDVYHSACPLARLPLEQVGAVHATREGFPRGRREESREKQARYAISVPAPGCYYGCCLSMLRRLKSSCHVDYVRLE